MNNKGNIVIYQLSDGTSKIDVKVENETVWFTQKQMSELLGVAENNITYHIQNVYKEGELKLEATTQKIRVVQKEGNREVNREVLFYNLDMIISVGYRVNSISAVHFRQWATKILKEYIIKGFALNDERLKGKNNNYLDELIQRIREIRASELNFYQKVRDAFTLSKDYNRPVA
ncbi:MAG TPA: RhuM family protein [Rickettsiales bacterium]|nr:RhuM family protein [Rickettsiales bacterium]